MNIKLSYHLFVLLLAALQFSINIYAQSEPIVTDTTYEATSVPDEAYDSTGEQQTYYPDTLKSEFRTVVYDSVLAINSDKGFYYKRYMDSLLRSTEVKLNKAKAKQYQDSLEKANRRGSRQSGSQDADSGGSFIYNSFFSVFFWIGAIGLLAFLIFKLFLSNSFIFSRNRKNISVDIDTTADAETNDPDTLLRDAIRSGNYRHAVRYLYLQTLRQLYERKLIEIGSNKTNYEYVNEVRKQKFANEFASLTLQYEYVWYGEYPVDEGLFSHIQDGFIQFNKNIGR